MASSDTDNFQRQVELDKLRAEVSKLIVETRHVSMMTFVTPFATAAAVMAATATLVKLFFN